SLRKAPAQYASLGRAPDGDRRMATHVPCVPDWVVQEASRVQLEYRSAAAGVHVAAFVHWISVAGRSARILGRDCGNEHGACHAGPGPGRTDWKTARHDAI